MMHQSGVGVLYLDEAANVIAKNIRAEEILNSSSRLWCSGKKLVFEDSGIKEKLLLNLERANAMQSSDKIFIKRTGEKPPFRVSLFPVCDDISNLEGEKSRWLMLVNDTEHKPRFLAGSMANYYDLTKGETALVAAVYEGLTLAKYAERRGIKTTTVRWTLDNIFSKTYTHSQSELRELANKFVD